MNHTPFTLIATVALAAGCAVGCTDDAAPNPETPDAAPNPETPDAAHADGAAPGARSSRFYVVNTDGNSLSVIDEATSTVTETLDLGNQPHGQAPSSAGDVLYVTTDGGEGEVIAVDTATHTIDWRLPIGDEINEPHLTLDNRLLYAPDLLAAKVIVVDVQARSVATEIDMIDTDGSPLIGLHNTYASHDGQRMYVTAIFSHAIAEIDVATHTIAHVLSVSGEPRPAAITDDDRYMYLQLSELHGFTEVDLRTREQTRTIEWPEPAEPPEGLEEAAPILTKCHGIGITPDGSEVWAASNLEGAVHVYGLADLEERSVIEVGAFPNWIAFSADGKTAYVTNTDPLAERGSVSVIDTQTRTVRATLPVGKAPKRIHRIDLPE